MTAAKALAFSDLHGGGAAVIEKADALGWFEAANFVVTLGDCLLNEVEQIANCANRVLEDNGSLGWDDWGSDSHLGFLGAVAGNHDLVSEVSSCPFFLPDGDVVSLGPLYLTCAAFSGGPRYKANPSYLLRGQDEALRAMERFPPVDILLAHEAGFHWLGDDAAHEGFLAIDDYLTRARPQWFLFGHHHISLQFDARRFAPQTETRCVCVYGAALIDFGSGSVDCIEP